MLHPCLAVSNSFRLMSVAQKVNRASCFGDWAQNGLFLLCGVNNAGTRLKIWDVTCRERQETGENSVTGSFRICAAHQILLV